MGYLFTLSSTAPDVTAALTTGLQGLQGDLLNYLVVAIPIVVVVVGAFFGIRKAISFFTKLANKG